MKKLYDRYFDAVFIERDTWIFVGGILLTSLVITNWSAPETWGEYLGYVGMLTLTYFPVLWFNWNKKLIRSRLSGKLYLLTWLLAHVVYPFVFALFQHLYSIFLLYERELQEIFQATAFFQFFLAIALEANVFLGKKIRAMGWLQKLGLEKSILFILIILSLNIGLVAVVDANLAAPFDDGGPATFFNFFYYLFAYTRFTGQIFLCFASLYFFYYINHYILIPKFLRQRGLLIYAASLISLVVLCYPIASEIIASFSLNQIGWDLLPSEGNISFDGINAVVPSVVMVLSIPVIIAIQWYQQSTQIVSLEKQQTVTELSLLKQQVNPHFFFNTLNNLYALSLKKSEQTPEVIMQLADLMRYVIYKGKESMVPLKGEIQYLQDYIQLQQIRLHKQLDFRFTTEVEDEKLVLPPLLFIILVENAFKHGIEPAEKQAYLHIDLQQEGDQLIFSCENSVELNGKTQKPGIGLENLKRRLDLLFPKQHDLEVYTGENYYRSVLSLDLSAFNSLQLAKLP